MSECKQSVFLETFEISIHSSQEVNSEQHATSHLHPILKKQLRCLYLSFLFAVGLRCFLSLLVFVQEVFLILNMFVCHVSLPSESDNNNSTCWN